MQPTTFFSEMEHLVKESCCHQSEKIQTILQAHGVPEETYSDILNDKGELVNAFKMLCTESRQTKYMRENLQLIEPVM